MPYYYGTKVFPLKEEQYPFGGTGFTFKIGWVWFLVQFAEMFYAKQSIAEEWLVVLLELRTDGYICSKSKKKVAEAIFNVMQTFWFWLTLTLPCFVFVCYTSKIFMGLLVTPHKRVFSAVLAERTIKRANGANFTENSAWGFFYFLESYSTNATNP